MAKKKDAKKKWMQKAFAGAKGQLHEDLGIPKDKVIPMSVLEAAAKKPGKVGQRARAALNARRANARRKRKASKK